MSSTKPNPGNSLSKYKEVFFKGICHWVLPESETESLEGTVNIDDLSKVVVDGNWKLPSSRLPHWLVHDAGPEIDNIANSLVGLVRDEMGEVTKQYLAGEMKNEPGVDRPLRFVHKFQPGHVSTTDLVMRAEGRDLYIRVQTKPRTLLTYLRYLWLFGIFLALSATILMAYFTITDAKRSWAQDFAQRISSERYPSGDSQDFVARCIQEGYYRTEWHKVRRQLRDRPDLVVKIQEGLISEITDTANRAEELSNSESTEHAKIAKISKYSGSSFFLNVLIPMGEGIPDFLAQKTLERANNDQYGVWVTTDENRVGTVGLKNVSELLPFAVISAPGLIDAKPLLFTETLKEVELAKTVADTFDNDELTQIINAQTTWYRPYSYLGLCLGDPRGALLNVLAPCGIIGSIVGFFVWRSPRSWLRHPCKLLGWIKPDDFESQATARNGRVVRLLSLTLQDLGFDRTKITELGD